MKRGTSRGRTLVGVLLTTLLMMLGLAPLASAQVPAQQADYSAYANGVVVHAEGVEQPELQDPTSVRVVDAEEAFSGAVTDSDGLPDRQTNELGSTVQPPQTAGGDAVAGQNSYGRGFGLDVSLGQEGQQQGQLTLAGLAEAVAPPPTDLIVNEVGPVPGDPLAYASLLRGEAQALYNGLGGCTSLGSHLAYGKGLAANAQLVDTDGTPDEEGENPELEAPVLASEADNADRQVSSSTSRNFFAAQTDQDGNRIGNALAVVSETRQTIAPVTFFKGTENEFTIELLGEWVLRAVATGIPGQAYVHYGPGEVSPETPLARIIQTDSTETILTLQDLLGEEGLQIDGLPVAGISIGEDPRAIGGGADSEPTTASNGTSASAAVDVIRVQLLSQEGTGEGAEIRVGHMEVAATVPQGGVSCDGLIPVEKTADTDSVTAGESFTYTITVDNPFQCPLSNVRIVDTISTEGGVTYTIDGTDPQASSVTNNQVVWEGLGPIAPGESLSVTIDITVNEDSPSGTIINRADVRATCEGVPSAGEVDVTTSVDLTGGTEIRGPGVTAREPTGQVQPDQELPSTGGGALLALAGLGLVGAAGAIRRKLK